MILDTVVCQVPKYPQHYIDDLVNQMCFTRTHVYMPRWVWYALTRYSDTWPIWRSDDHFYWRDPTDWNLHFSRKAVICRGATRSSGHVCRILSAIRLPGAPKYCFSAPCDGMAIALDQMTDAPITCIVCLSR